MKKDTEVKLSMQERRKGTSQRVAAARAGMSERTARKYEQVRQLPSYLKTPHDWQTRINPFEEDWPWVVSQLERDPALQNKTLFALLCERHPGRYQALQVRTLQRHIARWRALHGPEQEVIFEQRHLPGERAQSDFTHMADLGVTIAGSPFPHLVYHFVLTYSNAEAVSICFSETDRGLWPKPSKKHCGSWAKYPSNTAPIISAQRCVTWTSLDRKTGRSGTMRSWPTTACNRPGTILGWLMRMGMSNSPTTGLKRPSIKPCASEAVVNLPVELLTTASCTSWFASGI